MGKHTSPRPKRRVVPLVLAVVAALLVGGLGGAGAAVLLREEAPNTALAGGPLELLPAGVVPATTLPAAPPRTCSVDGVTSAPAALDFRGLIVDDATGEVLFEREPNATQPTASVMKLITAVAALHVLGPETRIPTRVVPGTEPGSVVIVGGGDPTLRSGATSVYDDAAALSDLSAQVQAAGGASVVGYDDSLFGGSSWGPAWPNNHLELGDVPGISALTVDGGRNDPTLAYSPRTATPELVAANAFASAVGARLDANLTAAPDAEPIAEVLSPPVRELVGTMLLHSDNVLAEALARLVAIELGTGDDFAAIAPAMQQTLEALGVDAAALTAVDGSGLSPDNRASAALLIDLLAMIEGNEQLAPLRADLPENMMSGTLDTRIPGVPAGDVEAKTGWIDQVFALSGWLTASDGTELRFAVFVVQAPGGPAVEVANRDALDAIITAVAKCGTKLSND